MPPDKFSDSIFLLITSLTGFHAYTGILVILLACGLGLPIPEDITLFAAGILVHTGHISLFGAIVVGFIGVLSGDIFLFFIGRKFGRQVFKWPYFRRIFTPERIEKAEKRLEKRRRMICFTARFMPGLRAPVFLTSGVLKVPFHIFIVMDGLAAAISVPVWIILAYKLGGELEVLFKIGERAQIGVFIALGLMVTVYIVRKIRKKIRRKKREAAEAAERISHLRQHDESR